MFCGTLPLTHSHTNHPVNPQPKQGFTLIELLVVIAIISILASILFPVFGRAREMARRTSCAANLKQIAMAISQYTQDYDERHPGLPYGPVDKRNGWSTVIQPYLKNLQVYQCPSEVHQGRTTVGIGKYDYIDYFFNNNVLYSVSGASASFGGIHETQLLAPAATIALGDGYNGSYDYISLKTEDWLGWTYDAAADTYSSSSTGDTPRSRHSDGANYAFADGHVKWLKRDSISSGCNTGWTGAPPSWCSSGVAVKPDALTSYQATFAAY